MTANQFSGSTSRDPLTIPDYSKWLAAIRHYANHPLCVMTLVGAFSVIVKIFVNLRIAFVSSSDQRSSEQTAGDGAGLQGQMWNVPSHRRDNCRHRDTRPRAGGGGTTCRGGGGTQQLVMIHTCCEVSIRRAAIQCLRITHSPSHNHQAVRYKWFDLETLSYTECKKWLDIRRRRDSPRYANMISNMQYRLPKIFLKYLTFKAGAKQTLAAPLWHILNTFH